MPLLSNIKELLHVLAWVHEYLPNFTQAGIIFAIASYFPLPWSVQEYVAIFLAATVLSAPTARLLEQWFMKSIL